MLRTGHEKPGPGERQRAHGRVGITTTLWRLRWWTMGLQDAHRAEVHVLVGALTGRTGSAESSAPSDRDPGSAYRDTMTHGPTAAAAFFESHLRDTS